MESNAGLFGQNVLLVEGDRQFRESLFYFFRILGCTVRVAGNAAEAKSAMEVQHFDLIISDYLLPDGNGIRLLQSSVPCQKEAIRILTTAYSSDRCPIREELTGIDEIVRKPFTGPELGNLVGRYVGRLSREGTTWDAEPVLGPQR
ncbi:MAG TPA: response regulator [Candidatus Deferrimicrobiaceae bacterium]